MIKLREAILKSELNGKRVKLKDLADKIFYDCEPKSRYVNLHYLLKGRTKRVDTKWIKIICEELNTTPNDLFIW